MFYVDVPVIHWFNDSLHDLIIIIILPQSHSKESSYLSLAVKWSIQLFVVKGSTENLPSNVWRNHGTQQRMQGIHHLVGSASEY